MTARGQRGHETAHEVAGLLLVGDVPEDTHEHERDREVEVQVFAGGSQHVFGLAQIGVQVGGRPFRGARHQRAGVGEHERVVVDVDDAGLGCDGLGGLVGVVVGGQPGPHVQELADPGLTAR
ncbi:hypothetical protein GCM10007147_06060 [Nocardiopsis kunsanensis]|uniref:Uncharacterized protein n=1 Tax=Nocardiopsis kunsanensis TaxID=141693 RepID=A0A918X8B9_9ACTN|nr:hypothetical protein GCM10007147_06060 [Nocardiopsis kunsanensis]